MHKIEIDLNELEKLGVLHCTDRDVAGFFGVSIAWVEQRKADAKTKYKFTSKLVDVENPKPVSGEFTFREIFENGQANGKCSLRRKQMELAQKGNPTMLIWLGKQLLGQKDQTEIGAVAGQEINVRIRKTVDKP